MIMFPMKTVFLMSYTWNLYITDCIAHIKPLNNKTIAIDLLMRPPEWPGQNWCQATCMNNQENVQFAYNFRINVNYKYTGLSQHTCTLNSTSCLHWTMFTKNSSVPFIGNFTPKFAFLKTWLTNIESTQYAHPWIRHYVNNPIYLYLRTDGLN